MQIHYVRFTVIAVCSITIASSSMRSAFAQAPESRGPNRGGFTLLLSIGAGFQSDGATEESAIGLAGLNLGIGGFLNDRIALMFRASGTNASLDSDNDFFGSYRSVAGIGGVSLQYWVNDRLSIEGGPGVGFRSTEIDDEIVQGLGLFFGAGYAFFNKGKSNLHIGLEYAPAFLDDGTVHNLGVTLGYQLL